LVGSESGRLGPDPDPGLNKGTLLGIELTSTLDNHGDIYSKIRDKIIRLASYWEQFRLSLPGRITIAKTFLLSQLNYTACWLPVDDEMLTSIQSIIDNFVLGTLSVSRERLYLPVDKGGLGLFNLKTLLLGIKGIQIKN
jgi:hypothetical protein